MGDSPSEFVAETTKKYVVDLVKPVASNVLVVNPVFRVVYGPPLVFDILTE